MKDDHEARGWPQNLETFVAYFDDPAAGDAWLAENVTLSASRHTKDITESPYASAFEEMGTGQFATPLREEALIAQASAYHPNIHLEIPMLMERGDPITRLCYTMVSVAA
jgi:hypothetical protein